MRKSLTYRATNADGAPSLLFRRCALGSALLGAAALPGGCRQEVTRSPSAGRTVLIQPGGKAAPRPANPGPDTPAVRIATDPCATQLHDVSGTMLQYYALNNRLPGKLEDLQPLADLGTELSFVCPASHKPYVYAPGGLQAPGNPRRLVLYDASADHGGVRWGVVMTEANGSRPPALWVIPLTEDALKTYLAGVGAPTR